LLFLDGLRVLDTERPAVVVAAVEVAVEVAMEDTAGEDLNTEETAAVAAVAAVVAVEALGAVEVAMQDTAGGDLNVEDTAILAAVAAVAVEDDTARAALENSMPENQEIVTPGAVDVVNELTVPATAFTVASDPAVLTPATLVHPPSDVVFRRRTSFDPAVDEVLSDDKVSQKTPAELLQAFRLKRQSVSFAVRLGVCQCIFVYANEYFQMLQCGARHSAAQHDLFCRSRHDAGHGRFFCCCCCF
jgi:hypothetical protein